MQPFHFSSYTCLLLIAASVSQAQDKNALSDRHDIIVCPEKLTAEGSCEIECKENALGGGDCPRYCTVVKPAMYNLVGNPFVEVISEQRGSKRIITIPSGNDEAMTKYYSDMYADAIRLASEKGDKESVNKLKIEEIIVRHNVDRYKVNINKVELHVNANRFFRSNWRNFGWFSGWMKARVTVKFECTSIKATELLKVLNSLGATEQQTHTNAESSSDNGNSDAGKVGQK